ncbi:uncharacterized protein LOC122498503 [Leptopilina heterotoma]|uniref:uncharacterized protein LOC122498503 n=1 Tax=Leptopilina heterotoma TaxID=63436 RepID=UPI001CA992AA|nr:uncharacterized protein LOC122498503 [Leptopilina heterotoma]
MPKKKDSEYMRYVAATVGTITAVGYGAAMTWTSPSIPYLTSENSPIPLSKEQSDIISSLLTVGYITGYIMNPFIIEQFGSKRTLLIYTIPQMTAWILINLAQSPITLYIARIFKGMGYGAGICALTIYLSEIGTSKTRGIFISYLNLAMGLGFFLVMLFGAYIPYKYMNLILLASPIIFAITFIFMPEASFFSKIQIKKEKEQISEDLKSFDYENQVLMNQEMRSLKQTGINHRNIFFKEEEENASKEAENTGENNSSLNLGYEQTKRILNPEGIFVSKEAEITGENNSSLKLNYEHKKRKDFKNENLQTKTLQDKNLQVEYIKDKNFHIKTLQDTNFQTKTSQCENFHNKNPSTWENFQSENELKADNYSKENENFSTLKNSRFWKMIATRNSRKALMITVSLAAQDVLSGHMVVWTFTQQLLTSKESPIDSEKATMFLALAKIIASGISAKIIEKTGRRNILFATSIIGTLSNITLCAFFFVEEGNFNISMFTWLPCFILTCYELAMSIGCSNFFYVYQAELFTADVKSMGVMFCKVSYMAFSYFCLFRFQVLMAAIGRGMIYLIFSIFSIILSIFVFSITPETQGKSNEEIQIVLGKKRFFVV